MTPPEELAEAVRTEVDRDGLSPRVPHVTGFRRKQERLREAVQR